MNKKIVAKILLAAFFNYLACTTLSVAEKDSVKNEIANGKQQGEIYITMNGGDKYHFLNNSYDVLGDTLYGNGLKITERGEENFKGKLAFSDIHQFEVNEVDVLPTIGLALGIALVIALIIGAATFDIGKPLGDTKL